MMTGFCSGCGNALKPTAKFCSKCGETVLNAATAAVAAPLLSNEASEAPSDLPFWETHLVKILGGLLCVGLIISSAIYFVNNRHTATDPCADVGASAVERPECATATAPAAITGQVRSMFIVADANVRDRATAQGSNILQKMLRGTSVSGVMQFGEDGGSQWFKLDGGAGFIGAVNLSGTAPPKLAEAYVDRLWNIEIPTDLLAVPVEGSAIVAHLNANDQATLAGKTENGYIEVKLKKGGVGYFLATTANDRSGALTGKSVLGATVPLTLETVSDSQEPGGGCFATLVSNPSQTIGVAPEGVGDEIWTLKLDGNEIGFMFAENSNVSYGTTSPSALTLSMRDFVKFGKQPIDEGINEKGYFDVSDDGVITSFLVYRRCQA